MTEEAVTEGSNPLCRSPGMIDPSTASRQQSLECRTLPARQILPFPKGNLDRGRTRLARYSRVGAVHERPGGKSAEHELAPGESVTAYVFAGGCFVYAELSRAGGRAWCPVGRRPPLRPSDNISASPRVHALRVRRPRQNQSAFLQPLKICGLFRFAS